MSTTDLSAKEKTAPKESKAGTGINLIDALVTLGIIVVFAVLGILYYNYSFIPEQNAKVQLKTDRIYEQLVNINENTALTNKEELIAKVDIDSNLNASARYSYNISYENNDDNYTFCVEGYRTEGNKKVAESGNCL